MVMKPRSMVPEKNHRVDQLFILRAKKHLGGIDQHHAQGKCNQPLGEDRSPQRPGDDQLVDHNAQQEQGPGGQRHGHNGIQAQITIGIVGYEHAQHQEFALRKAEDIHNAPYQSDAHRNQRQDRAVDDAFVYTL